MRECSGGRKREVECACGGDEAEWGSWRRSWVEGKASSSSSSFFLCLCLVLVAFCFFFSFFCCRLLLLLPLPLPLLPLLSLLLLLLPHSIPVYFPWWLASLFFLLFPPCLCREHFFLSFSLYVLYLFLLLFRGDCFSFPFTTRPFAGMDTGGGGLLSRLFPFWRHRSWVG